VQLKECWSLYEKTLCQIHFRVEFESVLSASLYNSTKKPFAVIPIDTMFPGEFFTVDQIYSQMYILEVSVHH